MAKRLIILLPLIIIMVSACAQNNTRVTPTTEPTLESTLVEQEKPSTLLGTATKVPGCTVRSQKPTPDATRQALLPPPSDDDWKKGKDDAYVTIIEYGDFQ